MFPSRISYSIKYVLFVYPSVVGYPLAVKQKAFTLSVKRGGGINPEIFRVAGVAVNHHSSHSSISIILVAIPKFVTIPLAAYIVVNV